MIIEFILFFVILSIVVAIVVFVVKHNRHHQFKKEKIEDEPESITLTEPIDVIVEEPIIPPIVRLQSKKPITRSVF